jgi:hypothetical protein
MVNIMVFRWTGKFGLQPTDSREDWIGWEKFEHMDAFGIARWLVGHYLYDFAKTDFAFDEKTKSLLVTSDRYFVEKTRHDNEPSHVTLPCVLHHTGGEMWGIFRIKDETSWKNESINVLRKLISNTKPVRKRRPRRGATGSFQPK